MEPPTSSDHPSARDLYVELEIEPLDGSHCPLAEVCMEVEEIRQQLVGTQCHADTKVRMSDCECTAPCDCTEVIHSKTEVGSSCPCSIFSDHDCVPELSDCGNGRIRVETYLPHRDRLSDLVSELKQVTDGLRLRKLSHVDPGGEDASENVVTLDLYDLTDKQRDAVARAVEAGYYAMPRETTLDELADEFDISKSALSQRLNVVESKLATGAFERKRLGQPDEPAPRSVRRR